MKKTGYWDRRGGFTFWELLLVIGMVAILIGLVLPFLRKGHRGDFQAQSENNLKHMALAVHNLNDIYKHLPATVGNFPEADLWFRKWGPPAPHGTLQYFMLPFIEQDNAYMSQVWISALSQKIVPVYIAPNDPTVPANGLTRGNRGATTYAANWNVFGSKDGGEARIPPTFKHGTSSTVIFAERYCICSGTQHIWSEDTQGSGPGSNGLAPEFHILVGKPGDKWNGGQPNPPYAFLPQWLPTDQECNPRLLQSFGESYITVAMGDASIHWVSPNISQNSWTIIMDPKSTGVLDSSINPE